MEKVKIGKACINNLSIKESASAIDNVIANNEKIYVVTPNVDHIVKLQNDPEFVRCYDNAGLVLADGAPLILASKLLGTPLKERVAGSDLFFTLCENSASNKQRLFFLGGLEGVAAKAAEVLKAQFPGINIVGTYSPPFGFEHDQAENAKIIDMINSAEPNILFVGVGAPKQEKWIYNNIKDLNINVAIGIGASFDFAACTIKRAPKSFRNLGMEWFWRFMQEPKRLFRRYFIDSAEFVPIVVRQGLQSQQEQYKFNWIPQRFI